MLQQICLIKRVLPLAVLSCALCAQHVPGRFYSGPIRKEIAAPRPSAPDIPLSAEPFWQMGPLTASERRPIPRFGARQIGVRRAVPPKFTAPLPITLPNGRRALRVALSSEGAEGIRLHFEEFSVQTGQVWLYPAGERRVKAVGPYTGHGPHDTGEFWSGTIASNSVIVEFDAPEGQAPVALPFRIDAITHQWGRITPTDGFPNSAASCELDVSCYPSYLQYASGVTMYDFVTGNGLNYVCSGAMINTNGPIPQPYMLTANHCISTDAEARSMQVFFGYQTDSCNGTPSFADLIEGATYLAGAPIPGGDFTLVKLSDAPVAYYFGWSVTDPAVGDQVVAIHHPESSWTRISFGQRSIDQPVIISGARAPADLFDQIVFWSGIIEPGSSGSPLLNTAGEIVGTLTAGPAPSGGETVCNISPFETVYGRFSAAYQTLSAYLNPNPLPKFTVSPNSLQFTQMNGVPSPAQQIKITTQSASPVPFTVATADKWLTIQPGYNAQVSATSPGIVGVQVYNAPLTFNGIYHSSVNVTVGNGTPVVIPVALAVGNTHSNVLMTVNAGAQPLEILAVSKASGGANWMFTINLTEVAGIGTTLTAFKVGGVDYSSLIPAIFGTSTLAAGGSINALVSLSTSDPIPTYPPSAQIEVVGLDPGTNMAWSRVIPGNFSGTLDTFLLITPIPQVVRRNVSSPDCPFRQHLVLQALGKGPVMLSGANGLFLGRSLSAPVRELLGSTYIPAGGTLQTDYCWPEPASAPDSGTPQIQAFDTSGINIGVSFGPALEPPPFGLTTLSVTPSAVNLTPKDTAPVAVSINPGSPLAPWDVKVFYAQPPTSWLTVSPSAGAGYGGMQITIKATGLASGVYSAKVVVQSQNAVPQYINIPITLTVPAAGLAVVSSASFNWGVAPGGIVSLFTPDMQFAPGTAQAQAVPLPTNLLGTTVTVNGVAAPLLYVSPTLVNAQVPYEIPPGTATLTVKNSAGTSASQQIYVNAVAPGVFLSADGQHIAGSSPTKPGGWSTLYLSGQGYVSPAVATGAAPPPPAEIPVSQLPQPLANVTVLVNGVPANILFAGIPYYLAGVTQVNYVVPSGTPAGDQPVLVVLAGVQSNTAYLNVTQ